MGILDIVEEDNLDFNIINSDAQILPEWDNSEYLEKCNSKMLKGQVCSGEFDDEIIFKIHIVSFYIFWYYRFNIIISS